jgi:hypothetical protein
MIDAFIDGLADQILGGRIIGSAVDTGQRHTAQANG